MSDPITRPNPHPVGYQFWHGAQGWTGAVEIRECRKGSYQCGPGLYLTTKLNTAKKYGRGAGCLVEFELAPTTRWLEDTYIELADMKAFLNDRPGLRQRAQILADLDAHAQRMGDRAVREGQPIPTKMWAIILVNLCTNAEVLSGSHGPALAKFLVEQGVDASVTEQSGDESWVTLFNPDVITHKVRHRLATVDSNADFPGFKSQRARVEQAQVPTTPPAPRRSSRGP